jgi:biotin transport system substrate-specific component
VRSIVFTSILTALMCVGSYVAVPVGPVPIVLQNLFVILAALILGPVWGTVSVVLFLLIGVLGLPVFSGGGAGFAHIAGPTGGYLLGYLPSVAAMGLIASGRRPVTDALAGVIGSLIIYACGVPWLARVTGMGLQRAIAVGMVLFLIGDGLKVAVSVPLARYLRPILEGGR